MRRGGVAVAFGLVLLGCDGAPRQAPVAADDAALEGARALVTSIPAALAERGPSAWLDYFEDSPSFFMVSDGAIVFADLPAARDFLAGFAARVSALTLSWHEPRYENVGGGVVVVTAGFDETIRMTDGTESSFGGRMSGVVRRAGDGWRLQHLHWSTPVAPAGGSR